MGITDNSSDMVFSRLTAEGKCSPPGELYLEPISQRFLQIQSPWFGGWRYIGTPPYWQRRNAVFMVFVAIDHEAKTLVKPTQIVLRIDVAIVCWPVLSEDKARKVVRAASAMALAARQSQRAYLQAQAAVQRCDVESRRRGSGGTLP